MLIRQRLKAIISIVGAESTHVLLGDFALLHSEVIIVC